LTIEILGVGTTIVDQLGTVIVIPKEGRALIVFTANAVEGVGVSKEAGVSINGLEEAATETGFMVPPSTLGRLIGAIVCVGMTVTVSKLVTVAVNPAAEAAVVADVGHKPSIGICGKLALRSAAPCLGSMVANR
jgi:hypothetical protein